MLLRGLEAVKKDIGRYCRMVKNMAMRDWNNNGKDDAFDMFMDYQLYKHTFGKENNDNSFNFGENINDNSIFDENVDDNFSFDEDDGEEEDDYYSGLPYASDIDISKQTSQEDCNGTAEIEGKTTEDILRILVNRKKTIDYYFETCSVESGFRDVMDNRQMGKDFWLFGFAKQLDFSVLQRQQKIQLLQLLLDIFSVDNPMTAEEHYKNMECNDAYYWYMLHCFEKIADDGASFWVIFCAMSGNEGERLSMTGDFLKEYIKFMVQLEEYLKRMFPESGFGGHIQEYIVDLMNYVIKGIDAGREVISNTEYLVNPVFPCMLL